MSVEVVAWERGTRSIGSSVVAIGVFDGVHLGHQALVAHAAQDASARTVPCVALTFDRDPERVVNPDVSHAQLLSLADKCRFLDEAGADVVLVIPFDTSIASMPPEEFVSALLTVATEPLAVHVGEDFRFGRFAEGDVSVLSALGSDSGFEVVSHALLQVDDAPVTSTRIRALVAEGALESAARLLGRSHRVAGRVVKGRGEGASLVGVPTANLLPAEQAALPASGVYAGRALLSDATAWPAAISVGTPPTFPDAHHQVEAHLLEFDGVLLHQNLVLEFHSRLRDQRRFATPEALASAIRSDIRRVKALDLVGDDR